MLKFSDVSSWLSTKLDYGSGYTYGAPIKSNPFWNGAQIKIDGEIIGHLVIPEGTSSLSWNFAGADVKSISLPSTFKYFDSNCLCNCRQLTDIQIESNNVSIFDYSFSGCKSLEDLSFLNKCDLLGEYSFYKCSGLIEVEIPNSITHLRGDPFPFCINLEKCIIGSGISELPGYSETSFLSGCTSFHTLEFAKAETSINLIKGYGNYGTFVGLNLTELIINRPIKYDSGIYPFNNRVIHRLKLYNWECLNSLTLDNCESLEELELSEDFDFINGDPFKKCDNLKTLICNNLIPPQWNNFSATNSAIMNLLIVVPDEAVEAYQQAEGWRNFWNITSVKDVKIDSKKEVIGRYDMNGRSVSEDYQGLVIVRFSDGSTKKSLQ